MKNLIKILLISFTLAGSFISCQKSELAIDNLNDTVDRSGAILRTLKFPATVVALNPGPQNRPTAINIIIEVQQGDGTFQPDFVEVRVYEKLFKDSPLTMPILDANGDEVPAKFLFSIPASAFTQSELNNLPMTEINIPTQSILDNFPTAIFPNTTYVQTRLELEMADGRVWTNTNVGATVGSGIFFASPFAYKTAFLNM